MGTDARGRHCDFCAKIWGRRVKARVDGALNAEGREIASGRAWADMCKTHHKRFGVGIGTGKGSWLP